MITLLCRNYTVEKHLNYRYCALRTRDPCLGSVVTELSDIHLQPNSQPVVLYMYIFLSLIVWYCNQRALLRVLLIMPCLLNMKLTQWLHESGFSLVITFINGIFSR